MLGLTTPNWGINMKSDIQRVDDETIAITTTVNVPIQAQKDRATQLQQQIDQRNKDNAVDQAELDGITDILDQANTLNVAAAQASQAGLG